MTTKAVTKPDPGGVPALVQPALDIGSDDITISKLKIGQFMSPSVQDGTTQAGSIYTVIGREDPNPNVLYVPEDKKGVLFHVLGMRRGWSLSANGELETWAFNDPQRPADAWRTWTYSLALPEVEPDMPVTFLLTKSGAPAAKMMNLILKKNEAAGPSWQTAFRLTTAKRENDKGKFYVARVAQETAKPANVAIAETLAAMVVERPPSEFTSTESVPDI